MLEGTAHLAVHSLKDVPTQFEDGLTLAAVSKDLTHKMQFLVINILL